MGSLLDEYPLLNDLQAYLNDDSVNYDFATETISLFEDLIKNFRKRCMEVLCIVPMHDGAAIYIEPIIEKLTNLIPKENFQNVILIVNWLKDLIKYYRPSLDTNDLIEQLLNYFGVILDFYCETLHLNCAPFSSATFKEFKQRLLSLSDSKTDYKHSILNNDNLIDFNPYNLFGFFSADAIHEILAFVGVVFQFYFVHIQGVSTSILNYFWDVIKLTPDIHHENFIGIVTNEAYVDFIELQLRIVTLYCVLRKKDWLPDETDTSVISHIGSIDADLSKFSIYVCMLCCLVDNFQTRDFLPRVSQLIHFDSLVCGEVTWVEQLLTNKLTMVNINTSQPLHVRQFIYNLSMSIIFAFSSKLNQSLLAAIFESMIHGLYEKHATLAFLRLCIKTMLLIYDLPFDNKAQLTEHAFVSMCKAIKWIANLNTEQIKTLIEIEKDYYLGINSYSCDTSSANHYIWPPFDDKYKFNDKIELHELTRVLFLGVKTLVASTYFPKVFSQINSCLTNAMFDCHPRSQYYLYDMLLKSTFKIFDIKIPTPSAQTELSDSSSNSTNAIGRNSPTSKSIRESIENVVYILCSMDSCAYIDMMTTNIDSIFKRIHDNSPILSLLIGLINNALISVSTVAILLQYIIVTVRNCEISNVLRTSFSCVIKSVIATANFTPTNETIICCYFPTLLQEISNLSLCSIKSLPQQKSVVTNYFFIIRTIFLCIGSTPNENVYQAMLPYMTNFALRLLNVAVEVENHPMLVDFKLIIYELCVTIPMKLFHLVPHANSLVSVLIKCLSTFSDILVFQALRTLVMILESIHAPHLEETIGKNKHSLVQVLISLHQRKNVEITKLANRAISSLGSLGRMFVDSLSLTQHSNVAIEASFYRNKNDFTNLAYSYRMSKYCQPSYYDSSLAIRLHFTDNPDHLCSSLDIEFKIEQLLLSSMQTFSYYTQPLLQDLSNDSALFGDVWQLITDIQKFLRCSGVIVIASIENNQHRFSWETQDVGSFILASNSQIRLLELVCRIYVSIVLFCMNNLTDTDTRDSVCNECFYFVGQLCRFCCFTTNQLNTTTPGLCSNVGFKHVAESRLKILWSLIKYLIESYSTLTTDKHEQSRFLGRTLVAFIVGNLDINSQLTTCYLPKILLECVENSKTVVCVKIELLDLYQWVLPPDDRPHVIQMYVYSFIPLAMSMTTKITCDLDYYQQNLVSKLLISILNTLCDVVEENESKIEFVSSLMVTVPNILWRFILNSFELVEQCLKLIVNRFPSITMKDLLSGPLLSLDTLLKYSVFSFDMDASSFSYLSHIQKIDVLRVSIFLCRNEIINDAIRNKVDLMYLVDMSKFLRLENDFHASPARSFVNCSLIPNYDPLEQGAVVTDVPTFYTDHDILDVLVDFLLFFVDHEKYDVHIARNLLSIIDNIDGKISNKVVKFFQHQLPILKIQSNVIDLITSHLKGAIQQADIMNHAFVKKLKCLYFVNPLLGDKEIIEHILNSIVYVMSSFVNNKRPENGSKLTSCSLFEEQFLWYEVIDVYLAFNVSTIGDVDFLLSALVDVEQKLHVILHRKFYSRFAIFFTLPSNLPVYLSLFKTHIKEQFYTWFMVRVMHAEQSNTLCKHIVDECFNYMCVVDFLQTSSSPTISLWNSSDTQHDCSDECVYLLAPMSLVLIKSLISKYGYHFASQQPLIWDMVLQTIHHTTLLGVLEYTNIAASSLPSVDDLHYCYSGLLFGVIKKYVATSITEYHVDSYYLYVLVLLDYMNCANSQVFHNFLFKHLFPTLTLNRVYELLIYFIDWTVKLSNDLNSSSSCDRMFFGSDLHLYWITKKFVLPMLKNFHTTSTTEYFSVSLWHSSLTNTQINSSVLGVFTQWLCSKDNLSLTKRSRTYRVAVILLVEHLVCVSKNYLPLNSVERSRVGAMTLEFCKCVYEELKAESSSNACHYLNLVNPLNEVLLAWANLASFFCDDANHILLQIDNILSAATNYNYNVMTKGLSFMLEKFVDLSPDLHQLNCFHTHIITYYYCQYHAMDYHNLVPIKLILYIWVNYQQQLFSSCKSSLLLTINGCISKMISSSNPQRFSTVIVVDALQFFFLHITNISSQGRSAHSDFLCDYQQNNFLYLVKYMCRGQNWDKINDITIEDQNDINIDNYNNNFSISTSTKPTNVSNSHANLLKGNHLFDLSDRLRKCYNVVRMLIKNECYLENKLLCNRLHEYFAMLILSKTTGFRSYKLFCDFIIFYLDNINLDNYANFVNHIASALIEKINSTTNGSVECNLNGFAGNNKCSLNAGVSSGCWEALMSTIFCCDHAHTILRIPHENDSSLSSCYNILDDILKSNMVLICEVCQEDKFALLTESRLALWNSLIPSYTYDQMVTISENITEYLPKCKFLPCRKILNLFIETYGILIVHIISIADANPPANLFSGLVTLLRIVPNIKLYSSMMFSIVKLVRSSIECFTCYEARQLPTDLVDLLFECLYVIQLHHTYDHNLQTVMWDLFLTFNGYVLQDNLNIDRVMCGIALGTACFVKNVRDRCKCLLLDSLYSSEHNDLTGSIIDKILSSAKLINNVNTNSLQMWVIFMCEGLKHLSLALLPDRELEHLLSFSSQCESPHPSGLPLAEGLIWLNEIGVKCTQLLKYINFSIANEKDSDKINPDINSSSFKDFIKKICLKSSKCGIANHWSGGSSLVQDSLLGLIESLSLLNPLFSQSIFTQVFPVLWDSYYNQDPQVTFDGEFEKFMLDPAHICYESTTYNDNCFGVVSESCFSSNLNFESSKFSSVYYDGNTSAKRSYVDINTFSYVHSQLLQSKSALSCMLEASMKFVNKPILTPYIVAYIGQSHFCNFACFMYLENHIESLKKIVHNFKMDELGVLASESNANSTATTTSDAEGNNEYYQEILSEIDKSRKSLMSLISPFTSCSDLQYGVYSASGFSRRLLDPFTFALHGEYDIALGYYEEVLRDINPSDECSDPTEERLWLNGFLDCCKALGSWDLLMEINRNQLKQPKCERMIGLNMLLENSWKFGDWTTLTNIFKLVDQDESLCNDAFKLNYIRTICLLNEGVIEFSDKSWVITGETYLLTAIKTVVNQLRRYPLQVASISLSAMVNLQKVSEITDIFDFYRNNFDAIKSIYNSSLNSTQTETSVNRLNTSGSTHGASNNQLIIDLKTIARGWNIRCYRYIDDIYNYNDIMNQRCLTFHSLSSLFIHEKITQNVSQSTSLPAAFSYIPPEAPSIQCNPQVNSILQVCYQCTQISCLHFATSIRRSGLYSASISTLSNIQNNDGASNSIIIFIQKVIQLCKNLIELYDINGNETLLEEALSVLDVVNNKVVSKDQLSKLYVIRAQVYDRQKKYNKSSSTLEDALHLNESYQAWSTWGGFLYDLYAISESDDVEIANELISCYLSAAQFSKEMVSGRALCRVLHVFGENLSVQQICDSFQSACEFVPSNYWVNWIPQIITLYSFAKMNIVMASLINNLSLNCPQALIPHIVPHFDEIKNAAFNSATNYSKTLDHLHSNAYELFFGKNKEVSFESSTLTTLPHHQLASNNVYNLLKSILENDPNTISYLLSLFSHVEKITRKIHIHDTINCLYDIIALVIDNRRKLMHACDSPSIEEDQQYLEFETFRMQLYRLINHFNMCLNECIYLLDSIQRDRLKMLNHVKTSTIFDLDTHLQLLIEVYLEMKKIYKNHTFAFTSLSSEFEESVHITNDASSFHRMSYLLLTNMDSTEILYPFSYIETPYNMQLPYPRISMILPKLKLRSGFKGKIWPTITCVMTNGVIHQSLLIKQNEHSQDGRNLQKFARIRYWINLALKKSADCCKRSLRINSSQHVVMTSRSTYMLRYLDHTTFLGDFPEESTIDDSLMAIILRRIQQGVVNVDNITNDENYIWRLLYRKFFSIELMWEFRQKFVKSWTIHSLLQKIFLLTSPSPFEMSVCFSSGDVNFYPTQDLFSKQLTSGYKQCPRIRFTPHLKAFIGENNTLGTIHQSIIALSKFLIVEKYSILGVLKCELNETEFRRKKLDPVPIQSLVELTTKCRRQNNRVCWHTRLSCEEYCSFSNNYNENIRLLFSVSDISLKSIQDISEINPLWCYWF